MVGGLVDVELELEAVAHLARRGRDDARAVGGEVDRAGPEPGTAVRRSAPREEVHGDADGDAALGRSAILGEDPAHDPLLDVAVEAGELHCEHPTRTRCLDTHDGCVDEDQEPRPLEADLEPELLVERHRVIGDHLRAAGGDVHAVGGEGRAAAPRLHLNPELGRYAKELPPVLVHTCSVVRRAGVVTRASFGG